MNKTVSIVLMLASLTTTKVATAAPITPSKSEAQTDAAHLLLEFGTYLSHLEPQESDAITSVFREGVLCFRSTPDLSVAEFHQTYRWMAGSLRTSIGDTRTKTLLSLGAMAPFRLAVQIDSPSQWVASIREEAISEIGALQDYNFCDDANGYDAVSVGTGMMIWGGAILGGAVAAATGNPLAVLAGAAAGGAAAVALGMEEEGGCGGDGDGDGDGDEEEE